jgi:hypothetical protein
MTDLKPLRLLAVLLFVGLLLFVGITAHYASGMMHLGIVR